MGSRMVAVVDSADEPTVLHDLPDRFEAWEQALSRFRYDSELCKLNRRAGRDTAVSQVIWDVFEAARQADALTRGLVNPLIGNALIQAGYDRSFDELPGVQLGALDGMMHATVPAIDKLIVDASTRTLRVPDGSQLDFGGIAKGWAADQAMQALSACGPALFGAGGDIATSGPRADGGAWEIAVDDPIHPGDSITSVFLERGGIATSGRDYRHWVRAGLPQHHIINPHTGEPAETDVLTATVIAPDAMQAEAMAKAVLIAGSAAGIAWLDEGDQFAGLLILGDGRRLDSRNLARYL
jgi:FAD:protein FMN transferase